MMKMGIELTGANASSADCMIKKPPAGMLKALPLLMAI
jgi:hypothetical protein